MNVSTVFREQCIKAHEFLKWSMPLIILSWIIVICVSGTGHAEGQNYLKGMKGDINATFGKESDLPGYLYAAETFVGAMTWLKTKSPWVFVGLPVLMIFTHWGLSYVS